jgi:hypothetical protein
MGATMERIGGKEGILPERSEWFRSRGIISTTQRQDVMISGGVSRLNDYITAPHQLLSGTSQLSVPLLLRPVRATEPERNRTAGNTSAPPGWILERGPVDPKPLKLGI